MRFPPPFIWVLIAGHQANYRPSQYRESNCVGPPFFWSLFEGSSGLFARVTRPSRSILVYPCYPERLLRSTDHLSFLPYESQQVVERKPAQTCNSNKRKIHTVVRTVIARRNSTKLPGLPQSSASSIAYLSLVLFFRVSMACAYLPLFTLFFTVFCGFYVLYSALPSKMCSLVTHSRRYYDSTELLKQLV